MKVKRNHKLIILFNYFFPNLVGLLIFKILFLLVQHKTVQWSSPSIQFSTMFWLAIRLLPRHFQSSEWLQESNWTGKDEVVKSKFESSLMTNQYSNAKLVFKPLFLLYNYWKLLQQSVVWCFNQPNAFVGTFHLASNGDI